MDPFRSVLWSRLDARSGDVEVLRLELHRHRPETSELGTHAHRHWQALVYLSGRGREEIGGELHPVSAGTMILLPPGARHAFVRESAQPPLCLMIDFRARWPVRTAVRTLSAVEMARIRSLLANLARVNDDERVPDMLGRASAALALLAATAEFSGWHPRPVRHSALTVLHRVQRLFESDPAASPKSVAAEMGYHPDHLSRLVREETGLGLRALGERVRLQRAQRLLREKRLIRDAADAAGFPDQNYFARWFKRQTGSTPAEWRSLTAGR
ncbi:MAG: AraC family transcriptional regulator [Terrimicrobiaceae bacterium]|nr:AraC family transcriptional regulator [Terrimicrobiaceae bacterium]